VPLRHLFHKPAQGVMRICDRLTRARLWIEDDEIDGVAVPKREADF
jgi:hypothetical protein